MVWEGGGSGGGLEASDNHNVSNVKIDTNIITSGEWLWECLRQYRVGKIGPQCL